MPVSTQSWAWYAPGPWPGFNPASQSNLNANGNGLALDPAGYREIVWNDASGDRLISDADTDDSLGATGDTVTVNGQTFVVSELGLYQNSTFVADGTTHSATMVVWILSDGSYLARLDDLDIPPDLHHSKVTQITLGQWDGRDYNFSVPEYTSAPFICFTDATLIATPGGARPAGALRPGDLVCTADNGPRPLLWTGARRVGGTGLTTPVLIREGVFGAARDLRVSPWHRMCLTGWQAEINFGTDEVLIEARHLVDGRGILRAPCPAVTYVHLLFEGHEILLAEGARAESFLPGGWALRMLDARQRAGVEDIFPVIRAGRMPFAAARPCLTASEARLIAS